jgi:hypothetical protein
MERERGLPASRKPGVESATTWIVGMIGLGIIAGLLVVMVAPPGGKETNGPSTNAEQVVPNTPPPVRTE